jgi:hypothetical protein
MVAGFRLSNLAAGKTGNQLLVDVPQIGFGQRTETEHAMMWT